MTDHPVLLFDGVCNFCNGTVNFVIRRDPKSKIQFAPLQSNTGSELAKQFGISAGDLQSFVFIEKGKAYNRSTAALKVCTYLNAGWSLCRIFLGVPLFIRDGIYNWIAKNRYKWFGKKETCMIPSADVKARFL